MATPFMNLTLPTVGVTIGPTWASNINTVLTTIDSHNHSSGNGALIPTSALNINADLTFGSFNATVLRTTRYASQAAALALSSDKECVYSVSGNLYYNNASGTAVQITSGTGLNFASLGTIGGDYGAGGVTASVTYNNTTKVYAFLQAASSSAKMAMADIALFEAATGTNAVTLKSPASLASAYSLTFPAALQAYTGFVRMTSAGVLQNDVQPDAASIEVSGSTLQIKDLGVTTAKINASAVTTAKIADGNITTVKILDGNVTQAKRASLGLQESTAIAAWSTASTSYVNVTNLTITITTTGRPLFIALMPSDTTTGFNTGHVYAQAAASAGWDCFIQFYNSTSLAAVYTSEVGVASISGTNQIVRVPSSSFWCIVPSLAAGTYTFVTRNAVTGTSASCFINYTKMIAYEL
jgi:hypothetical protein